MKKLLFIAMALLPMIGFGQDFRKVKWGSSSSEVMASEKAEPFLKDKTGIYYNGSVMGKNCDIVYLLNDKGKLTTGCYGFKEKYVNDNNYIDEFNYLKAALTQKYGVPKQDELIWKNTMYKDSPNSYGLAVSSGHLEYKATWYTETTMIIQVLDGENFKSKNRIYYYDKYDDRSLDISDL